jgi:hypothetical protein
VGKAEERKATKPSMSLRLLSRRFIDRALGRITRKEIRKYINTFVTPRKIGKHQQFHHTPHPSQMISLSLSNT